MLANPPQIWIASENCLHIIFMSVLYINISIYITRPQGTSGYFWTVWKKITRKKTISSSLYVSMLNFVMTPPKWVLSSLIAPTPSIRNSLSSTFLTPLPHMGRPSFERWLIINLSIVDLWSQHRTAQFGAKTSRTKEWHGSNWNWCFDCIPDGISCIGKHSSKFNTC